MAIELPVPDSPNSSTLVTLSGLTYIIEYQYNTRDKRYRLILKDEAGNLIRGSTKILENYEPFSRYSLVDLPSGVIFAAIRAEDDGLPVGRNNLGFNKAYRIYYMTYQEIVERNS